MKIKIFENPELGSIRTAGTSDEPLFCLADVCRVLNLRVDGVMPRLSKDGYNQIVVIDSLGREQKAYFVNEKNLYRVIMRSDKEEAVVFQDWVCDEVLPSIRKHGIYATDNVIENILSNPDFGIELLTKLKTERQARIKAEQEKAILIHCNKTFTTTEIAKELGMKSAIALNNLLCEKKIQFKQNGTWILYSKYADRGYVSIKQDILDNGRIIFDRRWTGIGRDFLLTMLSSQTTS